MKTPEIPTFHDFLTEIWEKEVKKSTFDKWFEGLSNDELLDYGNQFSRTLSLFLLSYVDSRMQDPQEIDGVIRCNPTPQWLGDLYNNIPNFGS